MILSFWSITLTGFVKNARATRQWSWSRTRPPKGFAPDAPHLQDLRRKDFIASANVATGELGQPQLVDVVAELYARATPFMRFLCRAIEVEF